MIRQTLPELGEKICESRLFINYGFHKFSLISSYGIVCLVSLVETFQKCSYLTTIHELTKTDAIMHGQT